MTTKRPQRCTQSSYTTKSWSHGKKTIVSVIKHVVSVRETIDRTSTNFKFKPRPRPERRFSLKPARWNPVRFLVQPMPPKVRTQVAAKTKQRLEFTLRDVLRLFLLYTNKGKQGKKPAGFKTWSPGWSQTWLEKARLIRKNIRNKVQEACGGYTGTVVARLDPDVKRMSNTPHPTPTEVQMTTIPTWVTEVVRFEHTTRPESGIFFVGIVAGIAGEACNCNIPNGNFRGDLGDKFKYDLYNSNGVNALFGNPGLKEGMPVGFRAAQFLTGIKGNFVSAVAYKEQFLRLPDKHPIVFPNIYATQFILDTLIMGKTDRCTYSDVQTPDGDSRQVRESVREKLFQGETFEYSHGMRITQVGPKSLNQLLAEPGLIDKRDNSDTGRHFFVISGRVPDLESVNLMTRGNANQYRIFCDEVRIYHIDPDVINAGNAFGDNLKNMLLKTDILAAFTDQVEVVEEIQPEAEEVTETTEVIEAVQTEVIEEAVSAPAAETTDKLLSQLNAYYECTSLHNHGEISENAVSAEEVINTFDSAVNPHGMIEARKKLRIFTTSSGSENVANAVRYFLVSHLTNNSFQGECEALNFGDYPWSQQHVREVIQILSEVGKKNRMKGMPEIINDNGNSFIINFGEEIGFQVIDSYIYDQRGRLLTSVVEMMIKETIVEGKVEISLAGIQYVSSFAAFMRLVYFGYLPLLVQSYANTLESLSSNFAMFVNDEYVTQHLVKFSKDTVLGQNAAALHRIHSEKPVLIHAKISPFEGKRWKTWTGQEGLGRFAKNITYRYNQKTANYNVREFWPELIEFAMNNYGLDYSFSKQVFVSGFLGHVRMELVKKFIPSLYNKINKLHAVGEDSIISGTTKPAKGMKRINLPAAQSANVELPRSAGWELYRQGAPLTGSLQPVALLPTLVMPPGISLWVGSEHDRPVGLVDKTFQSYKINVDPNVRPEFNLGCVLLEGDYITSEVVNVSGTWNQITPKCETHLDKNTNNTTIAEVVVSGVKTFIKHESNYIGRLNWIRWRVRKNMQLKDPVFELDVMWNITTRESWPKVRSIAKAMLLGAPRSCISLPANRKVNIIHAQDGIKADTVYAWLMVIGNTLKYNWDKPEMQPLRKEAEKVNAIFGQREYKGLIIELIHVTAGEYDAVQEEFKKIFGQVVRVSLKNMGDTGRMMREMLQTPEYKCVTDSNGSELWFKANEDPRNDETNITRFVFNEAGEIISVDQRCYGFASTDELTLYNVELFESSTVMEAVSESFMVPSVSRAMTYTGGVGDQKVLEGISKKFIPSMDANFFSLKAMFQMYQGGTFDCETIINVTESKGQFAFKQADYEMIRERLIKLGLKRYVQNQKKMFEVISNEFKDTVFIFNSTTGVKFSIYMPAVRKYNKLASSNEATETLSSVFFENAFKPMIVSPEGVPKVVISSVYGKLKNMVKSSESKKLLKGLNKIVAKRVGMPSVPISETWVLYSEEGDSLYQRTKNYMRKLGVTLEIGVPYTVYNGRDPMVAGWFSNLVVKTPEELKEYGWYQGPSTFAISPVASYIDGGDFDGDNHTITYVGPEAASEVITYERVLDIRNSAMGANMLFSGSYAFDHYTRKSFTKATLTLNSKSAVKAASKKLGEYISYNIGAHEVQNVAVGQCYKVCMIAENIIQLVKDFERVGLSIPEGLEWAAKPTANSLILAASEIYEIMLGGYSYEAYRLYEMCLIPAIREGKPFSEYLSTPQLMEEFKEVLKNYGANVKMYNDFLNAVDAVAATQSFQLKGKFPDALLSKTDKLLVLSASLVSFEVSRGRFSGFKGAIGTYVKNRPSSEGHFAALKFVYEFIGNSLLEIRGYEQYKELAKQSHVLLCLTKMFKNLDSEIGLERPNHWPKKPYNSPEFLSSFEENTNSPEEPGESDDSSGGSRVEDPKPQPPSPMSVESVAEPTAEPTRTEENPLFDDLTQDQKSAFNAVLAGNNVIISGEAGTGKTYLTQKIRKHFSTQGWDVVVTGSTGVSVMNIEGDGTFNSKLALGLGFRKNGGLTGEQAGSIMSTARSMPAYQATMSPSRNSKGFLFIVDEISMLSTELLALGAELVAECGIRVQWLLVGDPGQCSPVEGKLFFNDYTLEFKGSKREYKSFVKTGNFKCFALRQVVRQANDTSFLESLQQLRNGEQISPLIISRFKESMKNGHPEEAIHTFFNNECVKNYNKECTEKMIANGAEHRTYKAEIKKLKIYNDEAYERFLKWFDPIEENMVLAMDMPVMIRKNIKVQQQLIAANGTVGKICKFGKDYVDVKLSNGEIVEVKQEEIEGPTNGRGQKLGTFKQLSLHPAFAITGHKLQGLTLTTPLVVHAYQKRRGNKVPVTCPGWLYVVCSRVTNKELLYFDASCQSHLMHLLNSVAVDKEALNWINNLAASQS